MLFLSYFTPDFKPYFYIMLNTGYFASFLAQKRPISPNFRHFHDESHVFINFRLTKYSCIYTNSRMLSMPDSVLSDV